MKPGKALLTFEWTDRVGTSYENSQFDVKLNGQFMESLRPTNDNLNKDKTLFEVGSCPAESEREFCGKGRSESYGALVKNIKLANSNQCLTKKIVKY